MMTPQRFLLLQGPCSPFFARLGQALRDAGQVVHKINFSAGDRLYWQLYARGGQATAFRDPMAQLPAFYADQYRCHRITDLVLFGDCRPIHRPAITLAQQQGIRVHVFEEGYFRPYWITLERNGVNGHSQLPRDPDWYRSAPRKAIDHGTPFKTAFWKRAAYDVGYHCGFALNPLLHPNVQSHAAIHPMREYLGYIGRGIRIPYAEHRARRLEARLISQAPQHPFYLLPLQLDSDAQITHHSPFTNMGEAMRRTLDSFARAAPADTRLAVKLHPLDPGLINYRKQLLTAARELNIPQRVFFLESGNLPALLTATRGVVTVNSTVGSSALIHQQPVIALGRTIYNLPRLTFQGELDDFWQSATPPDEKLFHHFREVVIERTQLNGGFYCAAGIALAVKNAVIRLTSAPKDSTT